MSYDPSQSRELPRILWRQSILALSLHLEVEFAEVRS